MKILGNPGPGRITVTFEDGEFIGKSVTMDADSLVGGVALYASTIKNWDGDENSSIDLATKKRIVELVRKELTNLPESKSEIVE